MENTDVAEGKSESQKIINEIDATINTLHYVLSPICIDILKPEKLLEDEPNSELIRDLQYIKQRLLELIGSIRI